MKIAIDMGLQGSAFILLLMILRPWMKKAVSARFRYALWVIPALRLLVPLSLESPLSLWRFGRFQQMRAALGHAAVQRSAAVAGEAMVHKAVAQPLAGSGPTAAGALPDAPPTAFRWQANIPAILMMVWMVGILLAFAWLLVSNYRFHRAAQPRMRLRKLGAPLPVFLADNLPSPCLVGVLKPRILLNKASVRSEEMMNMVLCHELTHWRRRDHLWTLLRAIAACVWWWNPLVWAAVKLSRADCETACDEAVTQGMNRSEREAYGMSLIELLREERGSALRLNTGTAMKSGKKQMEERIKMITVKQKKSLILSVCLALVMAFFIPPVFTSGSSGNVLAESDKIDIPRPTPPQYNQTEGLAATPAANEEIQGESNHNGNPVPDSSAISAEEAIRRAKPILEEKFSDMASILPTAKAEAFYTYAFALTGEQPVWIVTFQNPSVFSGAYSVYLAKSGEVLYYGAPHVALYAKDEPDVTDTARAVTPGEYDISEGKAVRLAREVVREIGQYESKAEKLKYKAQFMYHSRFNAGAEPVWLVDIYEDSALLQRVLLGYDGTYIDTVPGDKAFARTDRPFEDFDFDIRTLNFAMMSVEEKAAFSSKWKPIVDEYVKANPYYPARNTLMYQATRTVFGVPGKDSIAKDEARDIGEKAILKLGAEDETLRSRHIGYSFDVTDAENAKWVLVFYPASAANPSIEITPGNSQTYCVMIDAGNGEILEAFEEVGKDLPSGFYR